MVDRLLNYGTSFGILSNLLDLSRLPPVFEGVPTTILEFFLSSLEHKVYKQGFSITSPSDNLVRVQFCFAGNLPSQDKNPTFYSSLT